MANSDGNVSQLLAAAHGGSREAVGEVLEACRAYLLMVASREVDPELRAKGGASDLVQETFLEAQRDFGRFRGTTEAELLAWLRQVLLHNVANFARHYRDTAKRDVRREIEFEAGRSSVNWRESIGDNTATPSRQAIGQETEESVQAALARLPEDYRQIILYRYQEKLPFEEIGKLMNRSSNAARKLWARAVERLQQEMDGQD